MPQVELFKVRRTLTGGRYQWLQISRFNRIEWVSLEIDGGAMDRVEAERWRTHFRNSNRNPDVIFHAIVPTVIR